MGKFTFTHASCDIEVAKDSENINITLKKNNKYVVIYDEDVCVEYDEFVRSNELVFLREIDQAFAVEKLGEYIFCLYEENADLLDRVFEYEKADGEIPTC